MKTLTALLTIYLLLFYCKANAQTEIKLDWLNTATSYYNGGDFVLSDIAVDPDGAMLVSGYFEHTVDFDSGPDTFNLTANSNEDIFLAKYSAKGKLEYAYGFGGKENIYRETGHSVATDKDGNVYMTGVFGKVADFDPGPGVALLTAENSVEIFVASYDKAGKFKYAVNIADTKGDNKFQYASSIIVDERKNVYVTGSFSGQDIDFDPGPGEALFSSGSGADIFLAKYDSAGNYVFAKDITGGGDAAGNKIIQDAEKNIVICGYFSGGTDFNPGDDTANLFGKGKDDVFFAKYDTLGNYIFAKSIGGTRYDKAGSVITDKDNNIIITGYFSNKDVDFDPGTGIRLLSSNGDEDIFVAKYDRNGNYIFAFGMGATGGDYGNDIGVDESGNIVVAGTIYNLYDKVDFDPGPDTFSVNSLTTNYIYFAKYSPDGAFVFANVLGNKSYYDANKLLVSEGGTIIIGAYYRDTLDVDPGIGVTNINAPAITFFIGKYDADGSYLKLLTPDNYFNYNNSSTRLTASTIDSSGNVYIAGIFNGRYDFDPGPGVYVIESLVDYNFSSYFAKYDKNGKLVFAKAIVFGGDINDITVDKDANIYLTGNAGGSTDFDPSEGVRYINNSDTPTNYHGYFFARYNKDGALTFAYGAGDSYDYHFNSITVDNSKNIYLGGGFRGTLDFNPSGGAFNIKAMGAEDIFFAKYDASGHLLFVKDIGAASQYCKATDLALNAKGNIILTGEFRGLVDFDPGPAIFNVSGGSSAGAGFAAGYEPNGNFYFAIPIAAAAGYSSTENNKLDVDTAGNVFISGRFGGDIDFNPGPDTAKLNATGGMFFASYTSTGIFRFVKGILRVTSATSVANNINSIKIDKHNNIYVAGEFGSIDIDCDPGSGVALLTNEYYDQSNNDNTDLFIAKYDKLGNYIYSYDFDGDSAVGFNISTAINVDKKGNIYYTGFGSTKIDFDPGPDSVFREPSSYHSIFVTRYIQQDICPVPDSLFTNRISATSAKLNWHYSATSSGFDIAYKPRNTPSWLLVSAGGNAHAKILTGLSSETKYVWKIRSHCANDSSAYSDTIFFKTKTAAAAQEIAQADDLKTNADPGRLNIYPNPVSDKLVVQLQKPATVSGKTTIQIFDSKGSQVYTSSQSIVNHSLNAVITLPATLAKGTYFIKIKTSAGSYNSVFIKS